MLRSLICAVTLAVSVAAQPAGVAPAATVDHAAYYRLLRRYVDGRGLVNYRAWQANQQELNRYLDQLSRNPPTARWSRPEQLAYWLNAYNAFTIRLILNHYPVASIKDIGSKNQTPWQAEFFRIGDQSMSLDHIEHDILRRQFADPRIHFALVCAAASCPRLRPEAYTAARLDQQLDAQGRDFLNDPTKNQVGPTEARLSRYFEWYQADWTRDGQSVPQWVNRYARTRLGPNARLSYLDYDWRLNQQ